MQAVNGKSVLEGIAIGPLRVVHHAKTVVTDKQTVGKGGSAKELVRFEAARLRAIAQQKQLYDKAAEEAGDEIATVFNIHALMLEDEEFMDSIRQLILSDHYNAEYAVRKSGESHAAVMAGLDDAYMAARSADIEDVTQTMLDELTGHKPDMQQGEAPAILVAEDLAPSETVRMDKTLLLGFVTQGGSAFSHTAILARSMNIPALVQCQTIDDSWNGHMAILDGHSGCLYIDPTPEMIEIYESRRAEDEERRAMLARLRGQPNETLDGVRIGISANISGVDSLAEVKANDADGVGLFRSEFVYLNSDAPPTEDEQFAIYRQVLQTLEGQRVVVRACDIGADKIPDYMDLSEEENPALGRRAVRLYLDQPEFFKPQLRALLRASCYGRLGVMFPMITSVKELQACKALVEQCRRELTEEGVRTGNIQVGSMIETPAAVLCADELAAECDFFSIGTNDLLQYTCAMDRQNETLEPFLEPHHPALLREIEMTVAAAHRHSIPVCICGELGADPTLTEWFLRIGVDSLSVNPSSVLRLREAVRKLDLGTKSGNTQK